MYNSVMNLRKYIWFEFGIWLLIIFFVVAGIKIYQHKEAKKFVTYQIFMSDVDGLIVGSPVRFMGIEIGYVSKIKILTDEIYLKIVMRDKNFQLPKGAIATVEFNGMGGSKSLEIYPPTSQSIAEGKIISVSETVRLSDALALLGDMYNKIDSIIVRMSVFAKETGAFDVKNGINVDAIEGNINMADKLMKKGADNSLSH